MKYPLLIIVMLLLWPLALMAATTYYIDFAGGNDGNNGLTKPTAWKRHPYMKGWAGAYVHAAGDQFIFKGGVTWDQTCFIMAQTVGGTAGNPDYYGVDPTWFTGGSWSRPIFSCGSTALGGIGANIQLKLNCPYTILDNIEFTGFFWDSTSGGYQCGIIHIWDTNIFVANCYIHSWTHGTAGSGTANDLQCIRLWSGGADGTGTFTGPGTTGRGCIVSNNIVNGPGPADSSGLALGGILPELTIGNSFSNVSTAVLWGSVTNSLVVHRAISNEFAYFPGLGFDGGHPNAVEQVSYPYGTNEWGWNRIHDTHQVDTSVAVMYWGGGGVYWSNLTVQIIHDNLIYNVGRATVDISKQGPNTTISYNNTYVPESTSSAFAAAVGTATTVLLSTNDHVITGGSFATGFSLVTSGNNLTQTVAAATASGYTVANLYRPPSSTSPTVNIGTPAPYTTDLLGITRPQLGAWDAGAYEYSSLVPPVIRTLTVFRSSTVGDYR